MAQFTGFTPFSGGNPFLGVADKLVHDKTEENSNVWLQALDILQRPLSTVAGFGKGLARGNLDQAFAYGKKGLVGDEVYRFDDVMKAAGIQKGPSLFRLPFLGPITPRGMVGFAADVAFDPVTYTGLLGYTKAGKAAARLTATSRKKVGELVDQYKTFANDKLAASIQRETTVYQRLMQRKVSRANKVTYFPNQKAKEQGFREVFIDTDRINPTLVVSTDGVLNTDADKKLIEHFASSLDEGQRKFQSPAAVLREEAGAKRLFLSRQDTAKIIGLKQAGVRRQSVHVPDEVADEVIELFGAQKNADGLFAFDKDGNILETRGLDEAGRLTQARELTFNPQTRQGLLRRAEEVGKERFEDALPELTSQFRARADVDGSLASLFGASRILDLATDYNMSKLDVYRNLLDADPRFLGSTRAAQAQKGQRSLLTFGGRPVLESMGVPLGASRESLRRIDERVFSSLNAVGETLNKFKWFRGVRNAFTLKTGLSEFDEFLSKTISKKNAAVFFGLKEGFEVFDKKLQTLGIVGDEAQSVMKEAINLLEKDYVGNVLDPAMKASSPIVGDFVLDMKKRLGDALAQNTALAKELGFNVSYLDGAFPRELNPEVKKMLGEVFGKDDLPRFGVFEAKKELTELTTNEINELFRGDLLKWSKLQTFVKNNPKWVNRLKAIDPETAALFVDDPALAIQARLASLRISRTKMESVGDMLKLFGEKVTRQTAELKPGEAFFVPSDIIGRLPKDGLSKEAKRRAIQDALGIDKLSDSQMKRIIEAYHYMDAEKLFKDAFSPASSETLLAAQKLFTELPYTDINTFEALEKLGVPFYKLDKRLVDSMNQIWGVANDPAYMRGAMRGWDALTNGFKRITTTWFPAFYTRNFISDIFWQNHLAGISAVKEWGLDNGAYAAASKFLWNTHVGKKGLSSLAEEGLGGVPLTIQATDGTIIDVQKEFVDYVSGGGLGATFKAVDLSEGRTIADINQEIGKEFLEGTEKWKSQLYTNIFGPGFILPKNLGKAGEFTNQISRFGHYLAKRKAGLASDEAMMSVKQFLFDYSELTTMERKVMKRIFPFYTWMRKNIPLQVELAIKEPGKVNNLQKALDLLEDEDAKKNIPEGGIPDFIKKEMGITVKEREKGVFDFLLLGSFIPAADLIRVGSIDNLIRLGANSLNPIAQAAIEDPAVANKNFYTGMQVERYPGERGVFVGATLPKRFINIARKIRPLVQIDKFIPRVDPTDPTKGKQFKFGERLAAVGTGIKVSQVDTERVKEAKTLETKKIAGMLNSSLKKAKERGDKTMQEYLEAMIEDYDSLRHSSGVK
jgi:hypothetical protein